MKECTEVSMQEFNDEDDGLCFNAATTTNSCAQRQREQTQAHLLFLYSSYFGYHHILQLLNDCSN